MQELNWVFEVSEMLPKSCSTTRKKKKHSIMNSASFTLHGALTPKLDTVPSEHTLLVVFFHLFIRHAKGLLGGPVL